MWGVKERKKGYEWLESIWHSLKWIKTVDQHMYNRFRVFSVETYFGVILVIGRIFLLVISFPFLFLFFLMFPTYKDFKSMV